MLGFLRSIWAYRGFVLGSVKREFQSKYQNSLLGATWNLIHPLAMILVYTVIFAQVMRVKLPGVSSTFGYSIYLCAGVLTWGLFAEVVIRLQNVFIDNANLLKKLSFPRLCLPLTVVVDSLLNFSIVFGLFTVFLCVSGDFPGWVYLALFPLIVLLVFFALGLGMVLGVINVFFRDVGQFFGIFVTFWFWFTPVVYSVNILPDWVQSLIHFNPMSGFMRATQGVLVQGMWPQWQLLGPMAAWAVILCVLGACLFRRHAGEMVDEL